MPWAGYRASGWAAEVLEIAGPTAPPGLEDQYVICEFGAAVGAATTAAKADSLGMQADRLALLRSALSRAVARITPDATHPMLMLAAPLAAMFAPLPLDHPCRPPLHQASS